MPSIEELLGDDEETETPPATDPKTNAAFAQQRKELAALKKEAEELRAFKAEREQADRKAGVEDTLKDLGVPARRAKYYPTDGEATPDAIKAWAIEEEFLALAEGEEAPVPETRGYTPTVIAESHVLGGKNLTAVEWREIAKRDPGEGQRLLDQGRVNMAELRNGLGPER